jgi:hypothetical protein
LSWFSGFDFLNMKRIKYFISLCFLVLVLCLAGGKVQAQCAMCRSAVESNHADHDRLSRFGDGLNKGILYLMAIPYILGGTVAFLWYRSNRHKG